MITFKQAKQSTLLMKANALNALVALFLIPDNSIVGRGFSSAIKGSLSPQRSSIQNTHTHTHTDPHYNYSAHCPATNFYHYTRPITDPYLCKYLSKMHVLKSLFTIRTNPLAAQTEAKSISQPEKETVQIIQHREVALPEQYTPPTPASMERCNRELRSLSPKDNICDILRIFKLLDTAFFDGRVGKVARVTRTKSKTSEMVAVGGRLRRETKGIVIRLPSHEDKGNSQGLVTILLREMAFIDFYEINTCQCEDCRCSNGLKLYEFVECLTRLDGIVNFYFKTFESRWEIMTLYESSIVKKVIADLHDIKSFQEKAFYTEMAHQPGRRHSIC